MRKLLFSATVFCIAAVSIIASTEGFKADISLMETSKRFKVLNIGSLAVGEKGLVRGYQLSVCIEDNILKVSSLTELDEKPNEYSIDYEIVKETNGTVNIIFSQKGKKADAKDVENQVIRMAGAEDCKSQREKNIPLLTIGTLFGAKSLDELITRLTNVVVNSKESTSTQTNTEKNPWLVMNDKSPIDDSPSVTMMKSEENGGSQSLILRCKENKTEVYISTSDYMGSDNNNMLVRFDDKKVEKQSISMSTNGQALFFRSTIKNIKKMIESKKMIIRYYPYNGGNKTATFNLGNLKEKISPLRDACHW
ncbi:MAG: hypothetical protein KAI79_20540 [Bacteroidales bacterium]|nr:hypothetical protein [Bacteroidales bacterium]